MRTGAGELIGYTSRTGTRTTLAALKQAGWGLLVSATDSHLKYDFRLWGLDNGAWTAHQQGTPWQPEPFLRLCDKLGSGAQWVVVPDIVAGGWESLELSKQWLPKLQGVAKHQLLAVQDGMTPDHIEPYLGQHVGIFVGGSTDWKLSTLHLWGALATKVGCYLHIGRVNSIKRINMCQDVGAHSFDGTSVSRFSKTLGLLNNGIKQQHLFR